MFTADEQRILDQLAVSGFDQHDVAGLTVLELQEELADQTNPDTIQAGRKFGGSIAGPGLKLGNHCFHNSQPIDRHLLQLHRSQNQQGLPANIALPSSTSTRMLL